MDLPESYVRILVALPELDRYVGDFEPTGDLGTDVRNLLLQNGCEQTYHHVLDVAAKAVELAQQFDGGQQAAFTAGLLHDIAAIVPNQERIGLCKALDIDVLPEEEQLPMIVHQKLSVPIARDILGIGNRSVLSAIGCHTTLKANASLTDKIVFVADKIAWDQPGTPPYLGAVLAGLASSIDAAALAYLDYLWAERDSLRVLHPWVVEARNHLLHLR